MRRLWRRFSGAERALVLVFLATLPFANPLVRGDGVGYYAYIRSLLIDGDLRFENEWLAANASFVRGVTDAAGRIRADVYTPTGYVANHFTVGPALLWAPPLVATHLLVLAARRAGVAVPADGYSWPYRYTLAVATAVYAFLGLWLSFRMARKYVSEEWALLATLGIWWGSSLPVYMYFNPAWAHAHSAFAVSLFLWYWFRTRTGRRPRQWFLLGLMGGLMVDVYYPNAVLLIVPGLEAINAYVTTWRAHHLAGIRTIDAGHLALAGAFLLGLLPTLITRKIIYGSLLASGYPPLSAWCWTRPWLVEVLFSSNHGLFSWTPILALAVVGLLRLIAIDRRVGAYLVAAFLAFYYLIASYPTWYGLSSYGNRFFVSLTPVFVIGLGTVLADFARRYSFARKFQVGLIAALIVWNLGLIFQWGTNIIPNRGPVAWGEVARNQVEVVPGRLLAIARAYAVDRDSVLALLQQEDLREVEKWAAPEPPCR
jgi:hypothetical protein